MPNKIEKTENKESGDLPSSAISTPLAGAGAPALQQPKSPGFAKPEFTYRNLQNLLKRSLAPIQPNPGTPTLTSILLASPPSELLAAIFLVETEARKLVASENHHLKGAAKYLVIFLDSRVTLFDWTKFAYFVNNKHPQERPGRPIEDAHNRSEDLIERLYLRIKWIFDLSIKCGQKFNAQDCLVAIAQDIGWMKDVSVFMSDSQTSISLLHQKYSKEFTEYVELNKKAESVPNSVTPSASTLQNQKTNNTVAQRTGSPIHTLPIAAGTSTLVSAAGLNVV